MWPFGFQKSGKKYSEKQKEEEIEFVFRNTQVEMMSVYVSLFKWKKNAITRRGKNWKLEKI